MSGLAIYVSVEGMEFSSWEPEFRRALLQAPTHFSFDIDRSRTTGSLGARPGSTVKVKAKGVALDQDGLKIASFVISALSLAIAATQLGMKLSESTASADTRASFVCAIEGPKGRAVLTFESTGRVPEELLRECIDKTGVPTRLQVTAP